MKMMKKFFVIAAIATLCCSCADDLDDYYNNPNALRIEVSDGSGEVTPWVSDSTNKPQTRVSFSGYHSEFQTGDAIGVYAFNGIKFVESNVKFTRQSDGSWLPEKNISYDPSYTYYAYSPYISNPYTPSTAEGDEDTKFANFISDDDNKFWKEDQSQEENFKASDLLISTGTSFGDNNRNIVKFIMNHKRGLAIFQNGQKYYTSGNFYEKMIGYVYYIGIPYTLTIQTVPSAYKIKEGTFYYLVKPKNSVPTTPNLNDIEIEISEGRFKLFNFPLRGRGFTLTSGEKSVDGGKSWRRILFEPLGIIKIQPIIEGSNVHLLSVFFREDQMFLVQKKVDTTLSESASVSDVDLSMVDNAGKERKSRTTANCYLVHAPGTYRIPLVYGNAIKNGATNTSSYHTDVVNDNVRQTLVNHADQEITSPWIEDNLDSDGNTKISVDGAKLIWEDMKDMIKDLRIVSDTEGKKYLTFTVDADHIAEGNAVVSATSNGTVVWSWHIWVTNQTLSTTTAVNTGSNTYNVADVNLGAVDADYNSNLYRYVLKGNNGVRVQLEFEAPLYGRGNDEKHSLFNTYYQWGRPNAIPSVGYTYSGSSNFSMAISETSPSIGTVIQNPETCYNTEYDIKMRNYWDMNQSSAGNISTATVKTVYDPCPPDFCVPTSNLFYYMSDNKSNIEVVNYDILNEGGNGPGVNWTDTTPYIYFPCSGSFRSGRNTKGYALSATFFFYGYYWSASAYEDVYNRPSDVYFSATSNNVVLNADTSPSSGYIVRPVREE